MYLTLTSSGTCAFFVDGVQPMEVLVELLAVSLSLLSKDYLLLTLVNAVQDTFQVFIRLQQCRFNTSKWLGISRPTLLVRTTFHTHGWLWWVFICDISQWCNTFSLLGSTRRGIWWSSVRFLRWSVLGLDDGGSSSSLLQLICKTRGRRSRQRLLFNNEDDLDRPT